MQLIACRTRLFRHGLVFLMLTLGFCSGVIAAGQKITLSEENVPLETVFREIKKQAGYTFVYTERMLHRATHVSVNLHNVLPGEILDSCFKNQPLTYTILNKMVLIKDKELHVEFAAAYSPPPTTINGKITSHSGEPLVGATVSEKGTENSTLTKDDGTFSIVISKANATLVISYIGFETREIKTDNSANINIALVQTSNNLNDVVVVGYGTAKRKDITGSISSIDGDRIKDLGVTRVDQALMGKLAGVQVKASSGEPGSPPQIRIRGIGSISAGVDPLYVVDGFPMASIQTLNPNDIESIDVLKDASATAIYGSRGSNGVVIINTRRGKAGKAVISFDTYFGYQKVSKIPKYQSALEEAQHYFDGIRNRNLDEGNDVSGDPLKWRQAVPITILQVLAGQPTTMPGATLDFKDHVFEVLRTAPQQQYQLTAAGGSENVKYALSGEFLNQDGIIINSNFKRFSSRANIDAKLSKRLSIKASFNPSYTEKTNIGGSGADEISSNGNRGSDIVYNAIQIPMYYKLVNDDGSYFPFGDGLDAVVSTQNPLALAKEVIGKQKGVGFLGNINAEYSILDELKFNVMLGVNMMEIKGMRFKPRLPAFNNNPAFGSDNASLLTNWLMESTLNYNKQFNKHSIAGLVGYTTQKENFESSSFSSDRFPNNLVPTLSAVSGIITAGTADRAQWSLISYLARANYNYDNKYYLTASVRTDGSSRFGSDKKYGVFPSAGVAWRISGENFMKDVSFVSDIKLRGSYGETGNNNIGNYDQYATINYEKYTLMGSAVGGYAPGRLANPSLTWEKQKSFNAGVDIKLFNNRVGITVDHFQARNYDLLLNVNVPAIIGFTTALKNIGEVKNTGWEFVLNTLNIKGDFEWSTDFNISTYRGEVVKLGPQGDPIINGGNITMIGQPVGMFFGWIADGIFKNAAELAKGPIFNPGARDASRVGDVRFKDVSGPAGKPDGIINSFDKTIMGSPYPDFYYGMTNRFTYKNISLSVTLQGTKGNDVLALERDQSANNRARFRQLAIMNDYWKSEQEPGNGRSPRPNDTPTGNWRGTYSTLWLDHASYLRVNNITLGYLLPDRISRKVKLNALRVYVNATNPFLVTDYVGFNPDISRSNNALTPGNANYDYPLPKSIILGLNLSF